MVHPCSYRPRAVSHRTRSSSGGRVPFGVMILIIRYARLLSVPFDTWKDPRNGLRGSFEMTSVLLRSSPSSLVRGDLPGGTHETSTPLIVIRGDPPGPGRDRRPWLSRLRGRPRTAGAWSPTSIRPVSSGHRCCHRWPGSSARTHAGACGHGDRGCPPCGPYG